MRRPSRARGFTLVETMIAGTIMVSMSLIAVLWISGVSDLWWTSNTQSHVRTVTQQAMNRVLAELRSGTRTGAGSPPNAVIPAAPDNTQVTFYLPADLDPLDGNTTIIDSIGDIEWDNATAVQFVYAAAQRQLQRIEGGEVTVLARDVDAATFEDVTINPALLQDEIQVTLTLQTQTPKGRAVSATAVETLRLRN